MDEILKGGREGIYKKKNIVYRPAEKWTSYIHHFLKYLQEKGFEQVPIPYGIDEKGRENISFLEGDVFNEFLPKEVRSDEVLISLCELVKDFHDLGAEYIQQLTGNEEWMLPTSTPIETMCHGDLGPYNIVMKGKGVAGIIDFDTLHPGSRMWDLAYMLYRWIPLMSTDNPENFGSEEDKEKRLQLAIEKYGLKNIERDEVIDWVVRRLEYLIDFMVAEADNGNEGFRQNIQDGHLDQYGKDLDYLKYMWKN